MGDRSDHFPLPAFLHEEYRRAKESPEVVARENEIEAEIIGRYDSAKGPTVGDILEMRAARAASRRKRLLTADSEWPRVASVNEDIERQR